MTTLDNDEFGPLESAEMPQSDKDVASLLQRIAELEQKEQNFMKERDEMDAEFGQKRARLKEMFLQKEDELKRYADELEKSRAENESLKEEVQKLKTEMVDIKTVAAILEANTVDADEIKRKAQEELASIQHILKESLNESLQHSTEKYEHEKQQLVKTNEKMENDLHELRAKLSQEREGFLASVAKSLKKVGGGIQGQMGGMAGTGSTEAENLEESMKKAQEDAEMLRGVVLPLEEEIQALKSRLREAYERVDELEKLIPPELVAETVGKRTFKKPSLEGLDMDEKVKELNTYLEAEKSSRTDLEMYVAVLNTQKSVLQEDSDKLRAELHEVCRLLEAEKKEHNELKNTWQMANDQFLESQRLMMMDMRRMETVLTAEQQRVIAELQRKDAEREAQEKKVRDLEAAQEKERQDQEARREAERRKKVSPKISPSRDSPAAALLLQSQSGSKSSLNSGQLDFGLDSPGLMPRSQSSSQIHDKDPFLDSGVHETRSLQDHEGAIRSSPERLNNLTLTEAQQKSLTDPTPESAERQLLVSLAKSKPDSISLMGKRIVSDREWEMLQQEVKAAREKLGRPCDMCNNYEAQLQSVQGKEREVMERMRTLEKQVSGTKQALEKQKKYAEELETSLKNAAEDAQAQITSLVNKLQDSEKFMVGIQQQYDQSYKELHEKLKILSERREEVQRELTKLQEENDSLVGKHTKHSEEMQNETINLPTNLDEMQLLLLKYHEDLISAKVAKEHIEDNLKSEIMFLKDQVVAEQQEKNTLEEALTQEINTLQEKLALLQSVKSELDRETSVRSETEGKLKEAETSMKSIQAKSKQLITALQNQLEEQSNARTKLETEVQQLRGKVQSLQVDLENSEAVQRDFVKLSQSLQIQLEKIRQGEHEVRWQHEEDYEDCNNCKQPFTVTKRKHHCRHCGKIFCSDCNSKTVNSGPNSRPSKVCDVCHTILVQDATPFFSTDLPTTPD